MSSASIVDSKSDTGAVLGRAANLTSVADTLTVSFHGLANGADAAARSMLRLLLPMLGNRWHIAQSSQSDVVILEAEALAALRRTGLARDETLYVVFSRDDMPPPGAFATIRRPMNSARLVEVLHVAQDELEKRLIGPNSTTISALFGDEARADLDQRSMRTTIRAAVSSILQDKPRAVILRDLKRATILSVLPALGFTSRLRSNNLADLIRTNAPVDLIELNDNETSSLRDREKFFPLLKLEWIYWLAGSDGRIRPGLTVSYRYQLRKYPDFAVLPHYEGDVRMATLLKAEPLTVGDLAQRASVRLETACHFVNACWSLGYLGDPAAVLPSTRTAVKAGTDAEATEAMLAVL